MQLLEWTRKTTRYSNGYFGALNKIVFFDVNWDSCNLSKDDLKYKLTSRLPGLSNLKRTHFKDEEEAFCYAEELLTLWLKTTGLDIKEN